MEKTSLEKSHSKWSNTKLTLLCIVASLAVGLFWTVLGLKEYFEDIYFYLSLGFGLIIVGACLVGFHFFKR